jgi:chemotaxis protein MotB
MKRIVPMLTVCLLLAGCMVSRETYEAEYVKGRETEALNEDLNSRLDGEKKRSEGLKKELLAAAEKLQTLRGDKERTDVALADATTRLQRCQAATETLSSDLDVVKKAVRTAEQDKADLRAQIEAKNREHTGALRAAEDEYAKKVRDFEAELTAREARLEALRGKVSDIEAEKSVLLEAREKLEQEKKERIDEVGRTYEGLLENMREEIGQGRVMISRLRGQLSVKLMDEILFPSGSAEVKEEGTKVLDRVAQALAEVTDKAILIEGHTDNVPISGALAAKFPTNWELSTARAVSVVRYLSEKGGIAPKRLAAVGYGDTRPVSPNDTPENKAKNRRIEVKLVPLEEGEEAGVPEVKPAETAPAATPDTKPEEAAPSPVPAPEEKPAAQDGEGADTQGKPAEPPSPAQGQ